MTDVCALSQINIVVSDMPRTLAFYRRFGWSIDTPTEDHAVAHLATGLSVAFDTVGFASVWDSGYQGGTGGTTVLGVGVKTRAAVDELYADVVAAGSPGRQPPYDAFWGSRFAIVEDPDGNPVGLMSPSDGPKGAPPSAPPVTAAPPRDRAFGVTHLPVPESFFDHSPESELVAWE